MRSFRKMLDRYGRDAKKLEKYWKDIALGHILRRIIKKSILVLDDIEIRKVLDVED